jgi:hypothetical protein
VKKDRKLISEIARLFPWRKLRRYEATNLLFEIVALFFTLKFVAHAQNESLASLLLLAVVLLGFLCVTWACKQ